MLKHTIAIFLLFSFIATAADPYVTIGTNRFGFVFEDTTLSTNMQARIIDDWKVLITPWTNKNDLISLRLPSENRNGELRFHVVWEKSIQDINCTRYDVSTTNGNLAIHFDKSFLTSYQRALQFADQNALKVSKIADLVNALQYHSISNMHSNQVHNYFYHHKILTNEYETMLHDVQTDLKDSRYYLPSILTFEFRPKDYIGHPNASFWWWLPVFDMEFFDYMPAIYIDERWKLHPLSL